MPQSKSSKKRNFAKDERLWEYGVVPYEIDPKISECSIRSLSFSFTLVPNVKTGLIFLLFDSPVWHDSHHQGGNRPDEQVHVLTHPASFSDHKYEPSTQTVLTVPARFVSIRVASSSNITFKTRFNNGLILVFELMLGGTSEENYIYLYNVYPLYKG